MSDKFGIRPPDLCGKRVVLRALTIEDAPQVFTYTSDRAVTRFTLWQPHKSVEDTRVFLSRLTAPTMLSWSIALKEREEIIGMVFLHSLNKHHRKTEIAFSITRRLWGQGLATEAAQKVLEVAFGTLMLNRVEATCMPENIGSRCVLKKLGMSLEGIMQRSHLRYDGFHDMELYAILHDKKTG